MIEQLHHVVEAGRVGTGQADDRAELVAIDPVCIGKLRRAGRHPVAIALDGIDLTVVRDIAEWLRHRPGGKCVGAVSLVEEPNRTGVFGLLQIEIERCQIFRQTETLVNDGAAGTRGDVKVVDARSRGGTLDGFAEEHQGALEGGFVLIFGAAQEELLDLGAGVRRDAAEHRRIHWDDAPAEYRHRKTGSRRDRQRSHGSCFGRVIRQENGSDTIFARRGRRTETGKHGRRARVATG